MPPTPYVTLSICRYQLTNWQPSLLFIHGSMVAHRRRAAAHDLFYIHMSRSGLGVALSACPGVSGKVHDITGCRPSSQVVLRIHSSSIPTIRRQLTPGMAATCFLQESESKWEHPYFPLPNICGMLTSRPYRLVCTRLSCDRGCAF